MWVPGEYKIFILSHLNSLPVPHIAAKFLRVPLPLSHSDRAAAATTTLAADLSFILLRHVPPPHASDLRSPRKRRRHLRPQAALPASEPAHRREDLLSRCPGLDVGPSATDVGRWAFAPSRVSPGALSFVKGFFKFNMNLLLM
jgi:hypothetical protein